MQLINLLKNRVANINILYLTEIRVCTESLIVENVSLKICKPVFETLKVWKSEVKTWKMGKKSLFLFSITELAVLEISYISIAGYSMMVCSSSWEKLVPSFFEVTHFKAVTVLEKVLNFTKLFTNPLKLLVLTVEDIMAWINVKLQLQA